MEGIGEVLQQSRESLGVELHQAAQETRIPVRFLESLEEEHFEALPAPVYVRGFLRSYAAYLGLDGQALIEMLPAPFSVQSGAPGIDLVPGLSRPVAPSRDPWTRSDGEGQGQEDDGQGAPFPFPGNRTVGRRVSPQRSVSPPRNMAAPIPEAPLLQPAEAEDREGSPLLQWALIGLAGLVILGLVGGLVLILSDGGDGEPRGLGLLPTPTPTADMTPSTVVPPRGTPTTMPAPGTPIATVIVAQPTSTPGSRPAPTEPAVDPTATPTVPPGTTPAASPTTLPTVGPATLTPAPPTVGPATPTSAPPTTTLGSPTPIPPTSTPQIPPHPRGTQECVNGVCGVAPYRVICPPDGWFLDVGRDYENSLGWPEHDLSERPSSRATSEDVGC